MSHNSWVIEVSRGEPCHRQILAINARGDESYKSAQALEFLDSIQISSPVNLEIFEWLVENLIP